MKAMISLEAIGYEAARNMRKGIFQYNDPRKWAAKTLARNDGKLPQPWVAELTACLVPQGFERIFLQHTKDFAQANGTGNRGVRFFFLLELGKVYEVQQLTSWTNKRRYFCRVTEDGSIQEGTEEEAKQWLLEQTKRRCSASQSTMRQSKELPEFLKTFLASTYHSAAGKTPR